MVRAVVEGGGRVMWGVGGRVGGVVGRGASNTPSHPALILLTTVGPTGTIAIFLRLTSLGSSSSYLVLDPRLFTWS